MNANKAKPVRSKPTRNSKSTLTRREQLHVPGGKPSTSSKQSTSDAPTNKQGNIKPKQPGSSDPLAIIAIDVGTTYSGFAFSFKGSKDNILTGTLGSKLPEDRVPTVILLNHDLSFKDFGHDAQIEYANISETERPKYFYLKHFKMILYEDDCITRESTIRDYMGREVNALHVFSLAIKYFKDISLELANLTLTGLKPGDIHWILTIPAIWTDSARQFMREAAINAGIDLGSLRLVLEPEAASLFCRESKFVAQGDATGKLQVGQKYILADLGGGTADICVHENLEDNTLCELYRATGGDFGGHLVNEAYFSFLEEVLGKTSIREFQNNYMDLYFEMEKEFERKKREFSTKIDQVNLRPEPALLSTFANRSKQTFIDALKDSQYNAKVKYKAETNQLSIDAEMMKSFFNKSVDGIIQLLSAIIKDCSNHNIEFLLLVGGYSESLYVRERISTEFSSLRVVLNQETRLAVLKGAVMMGFMPRDIVQRRARFTYGFICAVPYIPGEHPESLLVTEDGEDWCDGVFDKMIEKDQLLQYGDTFTWKAYDTAMDMELKHKKRNTALWRSDRRNPVYCWDEPGEEDCEGVAVIVHRPPPGGWPDQWKSEQQLIVGETEFTIKYINEDTGQEYETHINFL